MGEARAPFNEAGQISHSVGKRGRCIGNELRRKGVDMAWRGQTRDEASAKPLHLPDAASDRRGPYSDQIQSAQALLGQGDLGSEPRFKSGRHDAVTLPGRDNCIGPAAHIKGRIERVLTSCARVHSPNDQRDSDRQYRGEKDRHSRDERFQSDGVDPDDSALHRWKGSHEGEPNGASARTDPVTPSHAYTVPRVDVASQGRQR